MRRALPVAALLAFAVLVGAEPHQETIHFVHTPFASETERQHVEQNRFSIVLVPEGWTRRELAERNDIDVTFEYEVDDAFIRGKKIKRTESRRFESWDKACNRFRDALLDKEPFKTYRNFLKITRIDEPSEGSGVTRVTDNVTQSVNTAFGAVLKPDATTKAPDRGFGFLDVTATKSKTARLCRGLSPKVVVILVNDRHLRGSLDRGTAFPDGTPAHVIMTTNTSASSETFVHELGHAVANLGDEYSEAGIPAYDQRERDAHNSRNLSLRDWGPDCKWYHWNGATGIGCVVGGARASSGIYHPSATCCMIDNRPEFCLVCKERIIQRLYEVVTLIDAVDPDFDAQEAAGERNPRLREKGQRIRVTTVGPVAPIPEMSFVRGEWTYKDKTTTRLPTRMSEVGPVFEYQLPDDAYMGYVKFVAFDTTPLVRVTAGGENSENNLRGRNRAKDGGLRSAQAAFRTWDLAITLRTAAELQRIRETEGR